MKNPTQNEQHVNNLEIDNRITQAILDIPGAIIIVLDRQERIVRFNRGAEHVTGYTFNEVQGRSFSKCFVLPEDMHSIKIEFQQLNEGECQVKNNYHLLSQQGQCRLVSWTNSAITDNQGNLEFIVKIGFDVTDHYESDSVLHVSRKFLRLVNQANEMDELLETFVAETKSFVQCEAVGIRLLDDDGNIPYQHYDGFERAFYESENPLSISCHKCMCISVIRGETSTDKLFFTRGGSFYINGTSRFLQTITEEQKGQTRNVCNKFGYESVVLVPIRSGGKILGLVHLADSRLDVISRHNLQVLEDVANYLGFAIQRLKAKAISQQHEEIYRDLYQRAPNAFLSLNTNGHILRANQRAGELFGKNWRELIGEPILDLYADTPDGKAKAGDIFKQFLCGESINGEELQIQRADGSLLWVSVAVAPIMDDTGQVVESRLVLEDISARKHQEALREKAEKELQLASVRKESMADLSQALIEPNTLDEIAWKVFQKAKELTNSPLGFAHYIDNKTGYVLAPTLTGEVWERCEIKDKKTVFKSWKGIWAWPLMHNKSIISNDVPNDPGAEKVPQGHLEIKRFLCVPAQMNDELVGLVAVANSERDYTEYDKNILDQLARIYAVAIARERARQLLKESEARFHSILDNMLEGAQIINRDWQYVYINEAAGKHGRRSPESLIGRYVLEEYPGFENSKAYPAIKQCLETEEPQRLETEFLFPDGSVGWFELSIQPSQEGVFILSLDITERKFIENELKAYQLRLEEMVDLRTEEVQDAIDNLLLEVEDRKKAEKELSAMNEVLESFFSTTHLKIAYLDRDFNFIRVNRAYAETGGFDTDFYQGKNHFTLYPHEENEKIFRQVVETGEPYIVMAKPFEYPDHPEWGVTYWDWTLYPIKNENGDVQAVVLYLLDVTESENMRRELEQKRTQSIRADRLRSLGEMVTSIAHELSQPLMGIRNMSEHIAIGLRKGWEILPENVGERIDAIINQVDRMTHVIEHARLFARGGTYDLGKELVNINKVIKDAVSLIGVQLSTRDIELKLELGQDVPLILINPYSLEEIVINLINNARDACVDKELPHHQIAGHEIRVRTSVSGSDSDKHIVIEVSDTGTGMSNQVITHAFEPFFTTKDADKGTGLGLAICNSIAEKFSGNIHLKSKLGQGTTVTVSFPVEELDL